MGRAASILPLVVILAGCQAPRVVEVSVPVTVPGPVQYVPIPAELLVCELDTDQPATNGALLLSWQDRGRRLAECVARMEQIRGLAGR